MALSAAVFLLAASCSKTELAHPSEDNRNNIQQDNTEERILGFLDEVTTGRLKSSTTYDLDESIWLLESSLTYSLADPSQEGSEIIRGEARIPVPVTNQELTSEAIVSLYTSLYDTLYSAASQSGHQDIYLEYLNLSWDEDNGDKCIRMEYAFGFGIQLINPSSPFGPDDWWWYGMGMGKCNGIVCCSGKDATTEIMRKIMYNMAIPFGHAYFTDVETVILRNPLDLPAGSPAPNFCFFSIFYNTSEPPFDTSFHTCLSPVEMNYYYSNIQQLIPQNKPFVDPTNPSLGFKVPMGIYLVPSEYYNSNGNLVVEHILFLLYGVSHTSTSWQAHQW